MLLALASLVWMMIDDWRLRQVRLSHILVFGGALNLHFISFSFKGLWLSQFAANFLLLFIYLLSSVLYLYIRGKKPKHLLSNYFGLGDILFLLVLTPVFTTYQWLILTMSSFISAIVLHLTFREVKTSTIPFISYAGGVVIVAYALIILNVGYGFF